MTALGWRKQQMNVLMARRGGGKSVLNNTAIRMLGQAQVDGETWYTIQCKPSYVAGWVQEQDPALWRRHDHIDKKWYIHFNVFDMHEKLYTMMALKWKNGS